MTVSDESAIGMGPCVPGSGMRSALLQSVITRYDDDGRILAFLLVIYQGIHSLVDKRLWIGLVDMSMRCY